MLLTTFKTLKDTDSISEEGMRIAHMRKFIRKEFLEFFLNRGYTEGIPSPLIPERDKSVLFTGSATNTMKPFLWGDPIPGERLHLVQTCLRTQNAKSMAESDYTPGWASYFSVLGAITTPEHLDSLSADIWSFFTESLGIPFDRIKIRIASKDKDLSKYWIDSDLEKHLEFDTRDPIYYTHKYGMEGVAGRNCNLAIINEETGEASDIGNIIIIERANEPIAVEIAFGVETILSRLIGFTSSIQAALIADILPIRDLSSLKIADSLSASIAILDTGVVTPRSHLPNSKKGDPRGNALKRYLQALIDLRLEAGFSVSDIRIFAEEFETREFGSPSAISEKIEQYILTYERLRTTNIREQRFNEAMNEIITLPIIPLGHCPRKPISY